MYGMFAGNILSPPMLDISFFGHLSDPIIEFNPDSYLGISLPTPFNSVVKWVALYNYQDGSVTTYGDSALMVGSVRGSILYKINRYNNFAASSALDGIILPHNPPILESLDDVIAKYKEI